ncbi:MAG: hypothetical protein KBB54_04610 [Candidatus Pacebacteria bacterium]|nr:hypothetical protein [Candidatus Paceibacterota bacterium]
MRIIEDTNIDIDGPFKVFRDDLIEIENLLKKDLGATDFKIYFGKCESDDVDSIPSDTSPVNKIRIRIYSPFDLNISIIRYSAYISSSSNSLQVRGVVDKIREILVKRKPHLMVKVRVLFKWLATALFAFFINILYFFNNLFIPEYLNVFLIILIILGLVLSFQMILPPKSTVNFNLFKDRKRFWIENKNQILIGLIVGIPLAILSVILAYIF